MYIRLPARNASMLIDAVYYNPAGVVHLENGFHLAIHNQSIWQDKTVINKFPLLNQDTYVGEVNVPIFPSFFAVYKKDKLAISFGFGPNSGGGTADFATGLPSFEIPVSLVPGMISLLGVPTTAYSLEMAFKGKSVFLGFQGNISYAISDVFSVAAGARYISAVTEYDGELKNIQVNPQHPLLNPSGGMMSAAAFFTAVGNPVAAAMVADIALDVKQTGSAITPLLGMNIRPNDSLNIGIRYELKTNLEITNETTVDGSGLFPDGDTFRNDIPAILSLGIEYAIAPQFRIMVSYNLFFDKDADWDGDEEFVDSNSYDIGVGFEFDITDSILISAGYLRITHELNSSAFGFGGRIMLTPNISLDVGGLFVSYTDAEKSMQILAPPLAFIEQYQRTSFDFSIGFGFRL
jgi:long-chain fatty acid transport protein